MCTSVMTIIEFQSVKGKILKFLDDKSIAHQSSTLFNITKHWSAFFYIAYHCSALFSVCSALLSVAQHC